MRVQRAAMCCSLPDVLGKVSSSCDGSIGACLSASFFLVSNFFYLFLFFSVRNWALPALMKADYIQGCSGVGTAFPYLFALVTLFEDMGSKRLR